MSFPSPRVSSATAALRCSVVIVTCERPLFLERVLDALARQTIAPGEFEIVVCDDADCAVTRELVDRWSARQAIAVTYVATVTPRRGPAAMRNAGWNVALGDVIAFTDDDAIPDPEWLRHGILALEGADAAGGRIVVPLPDDPTDYEREVARLEGAGFVTANCFCRRRVLQCTGGFDPRFREAWGEDSDLFLKLIESGFDVVHATDAVVVRPVRPERWGWSLRAQSKHTFEALLYKKHPHLYARYVRPERPVLYYAIVAALATAVWGAALGSRTAALVGMIAWVLLTATLIVRRLRETTRRTSHVLEIIVTSGVIPLLSIFHRLRGAFAYRVAFW